MGKFGLTRSKYQDRQTDNYKSTQTNITVMMWDKLKLLENHGCTYPFNNMRRRT